MPCDQPPSHFVVDGACNEIDSSSIIASRGGSYSHQQTLMKALSSQRLHLHELKQERKHDDTTHQQQSLLSQPDESSISSLVCASRCMSEEKQLAGASCGPLNDLQLHQMQMERNLNKRGFAPSNPRTEATNDNESDTKKLKRLANGFLLHNSCKLFSKDRNIIESALQLDPDAIRQQFPVICMGTAVSSDPMVMKRNAERPSTFKYPINIALKHDAALPVLALLASAGPDVLLRTDGPMQAGTLSVALDESSSLSQTNDFVAVLLSANLHCARVKDRHSNTPLHYAAKSRNISVDAVRLLCKAYPEATKIRNFHGLTPLQVAQRSSCKDEILDCLYGLEHSMMEDNVERELLIFDSLMLQQQSGAQPYSW